jgi:hypothetical protein
MRRKSEKGAAIITILVLASVLFILLSVAVRGFAVMHKTNNIFAEINKKSADEITLKKHNEK